MKALECYRLARGADRLLGESEARCMELAKLFARGLTPEDVGGLIEVAAGAHAEAMELEERIRRLEIRR